jgi:soluble lytic murein transglycosylase-like protein
VRQARFQGGAGWRKCAKLLRQVLLLTMIVGLARERAFATAAPPSSVSDPYVAAAQDAGVPLEVLIAIVGAESAYHPWALNLEGRQRYCHSRAEAESLLANTASTNVDIGLMQINWRFWGPRLGVAKNDLLDPRLNLQMGARILRDGLSRSGSMWQRISNYHSGGQRERDRYNQQVYDAYLRYQRGELR